MAANDGNIVECTGVDTATVNANFTVFKSYFKVVKNCVAGGNNSACWPSGEVYYGGHPNTNVAAFIDSSGFSWAPCTPCGGHTFFVDINGFEKPNKWGQDRFRFNLSFIHTSNLEFLIKIAPPSDCATVAACNAYSGDYNFVCPSLLSHPCYFKSWLYE